VAIPAEPVLRAARRWLERLPASGRARCRALFTNHPDFSDLTPTQYDTAYEWLRKVGLLDRRNGEEPVERALFRAVLASGELPWLQDADVLVTSPGELPEDAVRAAEAFGMPAEDAYAQVQQAWAKVDTAERERIGAAGEEAVLGALAVLPGALADHVAAWSDAHGYDISVSSESFKAHLEVKATVRRGRLSVYVSRNEMETMLRDPLWIMVLVQLTPELLPRSLHTVPRDWIAGQAPQDRAAFGRWESFRLSVPGDLLTIGVPTAIAAWPNNASALVSGRFGPAPPE